MATKSVALDSDPGAQAAPATGSPVGALCVVAPQWVGDLVMATSVIGAAVSCGAFERVHVLCRAHLAPLLADGPLEPHVVPHAGRREEVRRLRDLGSGAALILPNSFGSAWRAFRAGVPVRAGTALSGRRWLLTHAFVPPTRDGRRAAVPTAHLHRDAAGLLGIATPDLHPRLGVSEGRARAERERLAGLGLGAEEEYVLCCPGAAFGAAKLWPPERFAAALDELHRARGWRGVVTGGPGEEPLCDAVEAAATSPVISLAAVERDLHGLKALVKGARLLLVGDSGPRWVAAAFDVPCVSVMGPNVPELTATSLELCEVVRVEGLECSPCAERVCPLGHHRCMNDLPVEAVLRAAERVLARAPAQRVAPSGGVN